MDEPSEKREGLARQERLRRRSEFLQVQSLGRKLHTPSFLVMVLPGREAATTRVGVTASKKLGGAVVRNRVKRRVREAFRRHKMLFPGGLDLVFIAKKGAVDADYEQVVRELETLCRKHFPR